MPHRFHIVDVFAETLYAGNTLAVVRDAGDLDGATMQRIAREFGFSETTFICSEPRVAEAPGPAAPGAQRSERGAAPVSHTASPASSPGAQRSERDAAPVSHTASPASSPGAQRAGRDAAPVSHTASPASSPGAQRAERAETRVRIFTPAAELPFAGHPTLGTAFVIREHLLDGRPAALVLALGVGKVPVEFEPLPGGAELAWLTAPSVRLERTPLPAQVAAALGLSAADLAPNLPAQEVRAGVHQLVVPLGSLDAVRRARLDLGGFAPLAAQGFPDHVYVFARAAEGSRNQLHARMFFSADGVREDPATGSATACLGAYLLAHGVHGERFSLRIEQGVEMGRPALLHLDVAGPAAAARIRVGGRVLESARGELI